MQRPGFHVDGLTARPWHDASQFPWVSSLEAAFPTIRRELLDLRAPHMFQPYLQPLRKRASGEGPSPSGWNIYNFFMFGKRYDDNCSRCPQTTRALEAIPRRRGVAAFSALSPGEEIQPHCGATNLYLRCHLGLIVPEPDRVGIEVGGQRGRWTEGTCIVLDDSFEHHVWNRGSKTRFILSVDVLHPDISEERAAELENAMLQEAWVAKFDRKLEETRNALPGLEWWRE